MSLFKSKIVIIKYALFIAVLQSSTIGCWVPIKVYLQPQAYQGMSTLLSRELGRWSLEF